MQINHNFILNSYLYLVYLHCNVYFFTLGDLGHRLNESEMRSFTTPLLTKIQLILTSSDESFVGKGQLQDKQTASHLIVKVDKMIWPL